MTPAGGGTPIRPARVVVIGAGGFVGRRLVERLLADGCSVVGITDVPAGAVPRGPVPGSGPAPCPLLTGDIEQMPLEPVLDGAQALIHLVGRRLRARHRVARAAERAGVVRLVHSVPAGAEPETGSAPRRRGRTGVVVLRRFTEYGPAQPESGLVPRLITSALTGERVTVLGAARRVDLTFVDDLVHAHILALTADAAGAVLDVGTGTATSLPELERTITDLVGWPPAALFLPDPARGPAGGAADTRAARTVLGYRARTGLREGLRSTIDWTRHARDRTGTRRRARTDRRR